MGDGLLGETLLTKRVQEDWIRKYEVSEEDRAAAEQAKAEAMAKAVDPMQGLEGLDVAGPKPASE